MVDEAGNQLTSGTSSKILPTDTLISALQSQTASLQNCKTTNMSLRVTKFMGIGFSSSQKLIQLQGQQCVPGIHSSRGPCTFQDRCFCFSKSVYVYMKLSDSFEKSLQPPRWPESLGFFAGTRRHSQAVPFYSMCRLF